MFSSRYREIFDSFIKGKKKILFLYFALNSFLFFFFFPFFRETGISRVPFESFLGRQYRKSVIQPPFPSTTLTSHQDSPRSPQPRRLYDYISNLRYTVRYQRVTGSRARTSCYIFCSRFQRPWSSNRAIRRDTTARNGIDIIRSPRLTQQQFRFEQRFVVTKICQWFASSPSKHFYILFLRLSLRLASIVNIIPPPLFPFPSRLRNCGERELSPPDTRGTKSRLFHLCFRA